MRIIIIILLASFLYYSCNNQKGGKIFVNEAEVDLDELLVNTPFVFDFKIENHGDGILIIQSILGSCYCIKPIIDEDVAINAHKEIIIKVEVLRDIPGDFEENFCINTNDDDTPIKRIKVKGYAAES